MWIGIFSSQSFPIFSYDKTSFIYLCLKSYKQENNLDKLKLQGGYKCICKLNIIPLKNVYANSYWDNRAEHNRNLKQ